MNSSVTLPRSFRCGYFDCSVFGDLSHSPVRRRTLFEIDYYLENGKHTYSDGKSYRIQRQHILVGRPGEECHSELPFKTKFLKLEAEGALADALSSLPAYFPATRTFEIEASFDRLLSLRTQHKEDESFECASELLHLLSLIIGDGRRGERAEGSPALLVERAKSYLHEHYAESVNLADIAATVNLSPSYFHSVFTASEGVSPHVYLTECRLAHARELLCATSLPIEEIARRCGFGSQQYMANVFAKRLGISPGKCRRAYLESYLR